MPPIDVKKEMTIATKGGSKIFVFTPDTGNRIFKKSTFAPPKKKPDIYTQAGLELHFYNKILCPVCAHTYSARELLALFDAKMHRRLPDRDF